MDELCAVSRELDSAPLPLSADVVGGFLSRFPLDEVFRILSSEQASAAQLDVVCSALSRLLKSDAGTSLLPRAVSYASAALASPQPRLRRLGCEQLGRLLLMPGAGADGGADGGAGAAQQQSLSYQLVAMLDDPDTGVAQQADQALRAWVAAAPAARMAQLLDGDAPAGGQLAALARHADATRRLRVFALLAGAAACSADAAAQLKASGAADRLLAELDRPAAEPLAALAAVTLLQELAEAAPPGSGLAPLLAELALPRLVALAREPLLAAGALPLAARLLAAALAQGGGGGAAAAALAREQGAPLAAAVFALLDPRGDAGPDDEAAALDAVLHLAEPAAGAALVARDGSGLLAAVCERALGRATPAPHVRVAALHALASVAGVERAGEARSRAAALLPADAEAALREGVFAAAAVGAGGAHTPAEALWALLERPFADSAVAVHRCLSALALRGWCAADVCSHERLLGRLLDPSSETGAQGCQWRHSAVMALWATCQDVLPELHAAGGDGAPAPAANGAAPTAGAGGADAGAAGAAQRSVLAAALPRIRAAVAEGPYGRGPAAEFDHDFHVATAPR